MHASMVHGSLDYSGNAFTSPSAALFLVETQGRGLYLTDGGTGGQHDHHQHDGGVETGVMNL